ncbi:hypothetical protein BCR34DRAFT_597501 [Clohesyomyces aquaticus]|uniref:Uncharacterized protein n=1 Tax=Clohesyomyces aquaticus TaxID=1231657 RepID=A0A1Y2A460_9PLEO|nr:hypothetical protein BCR34DRAFT_597501 [Clohesyomyces aquaticus]
MTGHLWPGTFESFGSNAPSKNVPFPTTQANITAIEILALLSQSLKSPDLVFRLFSNGATRPIINKIINDVRELERPWPQNSSGIMVADMMRYSGYEVAGTPGRLAETKIDVGGFLTPCETGQLGQKVPREPVKFAHLAVDVKKMPEGEDALDLTLMVKYAVEHEEEEWGISLIMKSC